MKKLTLTVAGLLFTMAAFSQNVFNNNQTTTNGGANNVSPLTQGFSGTGSSTVNLTQNADGAGSINNFGIIQDSQDYANDATVTQTATAAGVNNAMIEQQIDDYGTNEATVTQTASGAGSENTANIDQNYNTSTDDSEASITQNATGAGVNYAEIDQDDDYNSATVTQTASAGDNNAYIYQ
ncbi:hypothetical protein P1X15_32490, partial [Runella sp. MFBS21]|uniref:hypothetical protein n=1 Tax=Runella sp. MFBS21 TaxID=3034018 RepID=UPI0023F6A609